MMKALIATRFNDVRVLANESMGHGKGTDRRIYWLFRRARGAHHIEIQAAEPIDSNIPAV